MKINVHVSFKLFHSDLVPSMGTMVATVDRNADGSFGQVRLDPIRLKPGGSVPGWVSPSAIRPTVQNHVTMFLEDRRHPAIWNEEHGIESVMEVVA